MNPDISFSRALLPTLLCLILIPGCANHAAQKATQAALKGNVQRVAMVKVEEPKLEIKKNGGVGAFLGPIGVLVEKDYLKTKMAEFTNSTQDHKLLLGSKMSTALQKELSASGYKVTVLPDDIKSADIDDLDDLDYSKIQSGDDAILHVYYDYAGFFSNYTSLTYQPQLHITMKLIAMKDKTELVDETIAYGTDARKETNDSVPADPKYAYSTFNELIEKAPEAEEGLDKGVEALAKHVVKQLRRLGY